MHYYQQLYVHFNSKNNQIISTFGFGITLSPTLLSFNILYLYYIKDKCVGQTQSVIDIISHKRMRFFGHIQRMPDSRFPKITLEAGVPGTRPKGRKPKRWIETGQSGTVSCLRWQGRVQQHPCRRLRSRVGQRQVLYNYSVKKS